jgi:hypothetical protein
MKKVFLNLVILIISAFSVHAQSAQFGVKGGVNLATFSGKDADGATTLVGFHGGGLVSIPVSDNFHIQPEILYSTQGAKDPSASGEIDLSYITIPVLAKYTIFPGFSVEAGPQAGFLLSATAKAMGFSADIKSQIQSFDFSAVLGASYITSANVGFDARYNLGITSVAKDNSSKLYNDVIQLGVYYMFGSSESDSN